MRILIALLVVSAVSGALWASLDRPLQAPDWQGEFKGLSYSPSHLYKADEFLSADSGVVTEELIRRDMEQLSKVTKRVRTYSVNYGQDRIPYVAKEFGMKVSLGIWLGGDADTNEIEITKALQVIRDNPGVIDRVFVGNEAIDVRGELTPAEVAAYIKRVKAEVNDPAIEFGTAEVWGGWMKPSMDVVAEESDFIAIHLLPYWEGVSYEKSMEYVTSSFGYIQDRYPGKKIIIGETGWPSEGRVKKGAQPSPAMEAYFLRNFLNLAVERNYDYYIMEAFDQPWKGSKGQEGAVGAFWGIYDAEGGAKFAFTGPLTTFEQWPQFALTAAVATLVIGLAVLAFMPAVALQGYLLVGGTVALCVSGALFIIDASSLQYLDWNVLWGAMFIVPAGLFTAILLITESAEWALALWRKRRLPAIAGQLTEAPRVSIHVATYNEPPLMVMQTLSALSKLDYPNYEVIILDNNTKDENLWKPVESFAQSLGTHFRFYHFDNVKGFKAGALNKALALTDPAAEYVAVIDSDYQVAPHWLKTVMPGFADPKVAIVQAPQDYRDANESLFKSFCYEEYTGFFRIGMVERNEHNAVIQHGTMCVVRRSAMDDVGGWSEWCITEDTELGLRLFEAGYTALYTPMSMGKGLMPDTYDAYKGQRYRWVYGAMQILKKHAGAIFRGKGLVNGKPTRLTLAQRYHFVAGWLPWFADGFALIFGALALVWTMLMAIAPRHFDVPLTALSGVALALFTVKTVKTLWLHGAKVGTGTRGSIAAAFTGLALAYTVGKGVLSGLFTSSKPFLRTPKCEDTAPWTHALRIAASETVMLVATLLAIALTVVISRLDDPAEVVWVVALAVMAVPYAAAFGVALGSTIKLGDRTVLQPELGPVSPAPTYQTSKLDAAA